MKQAVCILIENEDNLFLGVSRKNNFNDFGLPGGSVDPGENPEQAIRRELKEETGLDVSSLIPIFISFGENHEVITFTGNVFGTISSSEEGVVRWVSKQDLIDGSFGDYNTRMFKYLESLDDF